MTRLILSLIILLSLQVNAHMAYTSHSFYRGYYRPHHSMYNYRPYYNPYLYRRHYNSLDSHRRKFYLICLSYGGGSGCYDKSRKYLRGFWER